MSVAVLTERLDRDASRVRTRWSMSVSTVLHALLFAWLLMMPHAEPGAPTMTEITFIEGGDAPAAAVAASPAAAPEVVPGALVSRPEDVHFRRESRRAEIEPSPQSEVALDDRIQSRLAALQSTAVRPSVGVTASAPTTLWSGGPARLGGTGTGGTAPVALSRGGGGGGPSVALTRGPGRGLVPTLAPAPAPERSAASEPARGGESSARRSLAGATLMGPIADREVIQHVSPVYPEWAKREVVEGSVTLYFIVRADGSIKENVLVQRTAGFEDFDENARAALRAWRFEPLRDGRTGEQWGTITFHYRIRSGG